MRRRRLNLEEAVQAWAACEAIPVQLVDIDVGMALRLASERGLYAYDAYVLKLAHDRRLPLLTLDQPLQRAAEALHVALWEIER